MAGIKFYYKYDKDSHMGKVVMSTSADGYIVETTHLVDRIICNVATTTKRQDEDPKFVVEGVCDDYLLDNTAGEKVIVLI